MTDRARSGRSPAMVVVITALGGFLIVLTLLSIQMRTGRDPALKGATAAAAVPRTIVKRQIIKTRVIVTDAPSPGSTTPTSPATGAPASSTAASAPRVAAPPVQTVQAAPAPVPAPVTRTS